MAIIDTNANNWYQIDKDEDQSIGLSLPLILDNGQEASTKTTLEAVKNNLLNLCNTEMGERPMQPLLGIKLKQFIFEQYNDELVHKVQDAVTQSINYWLPFIKINNIIVKMSDTQSGDFRSTMEVTINFSLKKDPTTYESIQVSVSG
tara:strand:+ start:232 stop:672 length:441 start_codon:yes stop_codon:yes gene_type:complete